MPVGGGMQLPPSGFTNACVHSAAQHALLEDIQSLRPAGTTPSTGVWVPVTDSNKDLIMDTVNRAALLFNTLQVLNFFFFGMSQLQTEWS